MALQSLPQNQITLLNSILRLVISITDVNGNPTDPYLLTTNYFAVGATQYIFTDSWPAPAARIQRTGVGQFYIDLGNQSPNLETNSLGEFLMDWQVTLTAGGQITDTLEKVKVISTYEASYLPELRLMIDKSAKLIQPQSNIFLGYTDSNMCTYLESGLSEINAYPPQIAFRFENWPIVYKQVLLDAAVLVGAQSQTLYAVDTDVSTYNDNGISFSIQHQPQLAAYLNYLTQRLATTVQSCKLALIRPGSLHTTLGPDARLTSLLVAAPAQSIFRGLYVSGQ